MTTKSETRAKKASEAIALSRQEMPPVFSRQQLRKYLQKNKCPYVHNLIYGLSAHKVIVKVDKDTFRFAEDKPVHFATVLPMLDQYVATMNRSKGIVKSVEAPKTVVKMTVEEATLFLKSQGYKILKPVTTFEEL